jgi:glycosyltransferase involved in cell wall biosynthesis
VVGPTPPPAHGVAVVTQHVLDSDLKNHWRVVHLDTSDRRRLSNIGRIDFRNIYLALKHALQFQWLCLTCRPDVIYMPIAAMTLGFLRDSLFLIPARLFGENVVLHSHGGYIDTQYANANKLLAWLMRFCIGQANLAIVLGDTFRSTLDGLLPAERVRVVPLGIPSDIFDAAKGNPGTRGQTRKRVLYLGTLVESKGFFDLIRAVPAVLQEMNDVEFLFVGDNSHPEVEAARGWVKQHALESYVHFLGPKFGDEKIRVLLEADVLAFPTWYPLEGQPVVVLEAMAAGLPILTTRHATIPDVLGQDGALYVRARDTSDIARQLCCLLRDEQLRDRMSRRNLERFTNSHTLPRFEQNLRSVLEEALAINCAKRGVSENV